MTYLVYKRAFIQFNQFLDSRADIHQIFALVFGKFKTSEGHSEINWPLIEPKKENLSRQAKKKAARFEKLKQRRQESRKFKKDLAKERKKNQPKGQDISKRNCGVHSQFSQNSTNFDSSKSTKWSNHNKKSKGWFDEFDLAEYHNSHT